MILLRKLGWTCSKSFLYTGNRFVCASFLMLWGFGIAFGLRYLTLSFHPGWLLWLFSVFSGVYASVPNYGLFSIDAIPEHAQNRHYGIQWLPLLTFMVSFVTVTAFLHK